MSEISGNVRSEEKWRREILGRDEGTARVFKLYVAITRQKYDLVMFGALTTRRQHS